MDSWNPSFRNSLRIVGCSCRDPVSLNCLRKMSSSCRHTFNRLLERAGVSEADRKRLMGHSLKGDLLNGTYGHRSLEELRAEVEKIVV